MRSGQVTGRRIFALHVVEMLAVMFVGMGVLSGLAALVLAAVGTSYAAQPGPARVLWMGVAMTAPMVLWMALRGHAVARTGEMAAAMMLPTLVAAGMVWAGAAEVMTGLLIQHVVMVPAMVVVMLWRYQEYSGHHRIVRRTAVGA
jgi:flagellar biosynthetic protein FliP